MQLKTKIEQYIYWLIFTLLNLLSLFFKLRNLDFVEYKYDQQFAYSVVDNCKNGEIFNYIQNSAGVPTGPLIYLYECIGGLFRVSSYQLLLIFEIMISHLLLMFLFFHLQKFLKPYNNLLLFLTICLNPFLIIMTRNPGVTAHFELFTVLFLYLYLNRDRRDRNYFYIGFISSISFAAYIPIFVINYSILLTLLLFKKVKNLKLLIFGSLTGFVISILSFVPYYRNNILEFPRSRAGSWGLSSYWRILSDVLSGKSIKAKINSPEDYLILNEYFSQFNFFVNLNFVLISLILIYSFVYFFKKIYAKQIDDFDILYFGSFIVCGIIFTLLDVPLYAHYLLSVSVLIFIYLFKTIKKTSVLIVLFNIFLLSSVYINYSFHEYIYHNNGAQNSDYGTSFNVCGCCVEDARVCRGQ